MTQPRRMRFATAQAAVNSIHEHHQAEQCALALQLIHAVGSWKVSDLCAMSAMLLASALNLSEPDDRETMENAVGLMARQILAESTLPSVAEPVGRA